MSSKYVYLTVAWFGLGIVCYELGGLLALGAFVAFFGFLAAEVSE